MEAPTDKATLLAALAHGRAAWEALLARVDPAALTMPGVEGSWSVCDILAHVTPYEAYAAAHASDLRQHGRIAADEVAALDAYYNGRLAIYRQEHPELPDDVEQLASDQLNALFVADYAGRAPAEALTLSAAPPTTHCTRRSSSSTRPPWPCRTPSSTTDRSW
ncbi:MAG: hypothetical protein U0Z44_07115 [Kouleothrix sp.]